MYKSSNQTFIFKYLFPVIFLVGGSIAIFYMWNSEGELGRGFIYAFCVAYAWNMIFLVQLPFRLKSIVASEDGVKIIEGDSHKLIKYKNIDCLAKFDLHAPLFVTLKYNEEKTNLSKKIAFMPSKNDQIPFNEDKLTTYIKQNMKLHVPHYDESIHPSSFSNLIKLFLFSLPAIALMLYFLKDTIF